MVTWPPVPAPPLRPAGPWVAGERFSREDQPEGLGGAFCGVFCVGGRAQADFPRLGMDCYFGPKALRSPIAMEIRARQVRKAGALELRPAMRIQTPKPAIPIEI